MVSDDMLIEQLFERAEKDLANIKAILDKLSQVQLDLARIKNVIGVNYAKYEGSPKDRPHTIWQDYEVFKRLTPEQAVFHTLEFLTAKITELEKRIGEKD